MKILNKIEAVKDNKFSKHQDEKKRKFSEDSPYATVDKVPYRGYGFTEDLSPWMKFTVPIIGEIRFNPLVSGLSIALIWGFVIWCAIQGEDVPFIQWKAWIVAKFTWLYVGSQDLWAVFAIVLYCSKYGNIKLGKPDEKPEFNDVTWFMMLFACGIGVGLFFYGVAEPIYHYTGKNRYSADSTMPDNTLAQIAINLTLYHWGIHGWIVYSLVGLLLGLMVYRENLPMTMKSCFYPLIGDRIFGWMGDLIDVVSIMTTLFGVCTSLGLGTRQLNAGLHMVNSDIPADDVTIQVICIWCITAIATVSTVSGVGMGIRRLSEICFMVGMFIMTVAFFMDETFYILNLFVQSIGFYFQYIMQLGWHTDAFEQVLPSYGGVENRGRFIPEGFEKPDGPDDWMDDWTMFYWGWWISWCPFVGMFIAKISRGRTIRSFINGTITIPVVYSFMWMVLFGGIGIRQERLAGQIGLCCMDKSNWFIGLDNTTIFGDATPIDLKNAMLNETFIDVDPKRSSWMCEDGQCGECATNVIKLHSGTSFSDFISEYSDLGSDFGSTSKDRQIVRLSCHSTEQMWFDVMRSYLGVGKFLAFFSLFAIVLYFVTSSDSGSLVIDCLSANGDPDPPRIQRVFWAFMEGATATALLVAGGKKGLAALQTAGIVSGLPYTVVVCLLCTSIWRAVKVAAGDLDPHGPTFACGLFDPMMAEPRKNMNMSRVAMLFKKWAMNIFLAPITIAKVSARVYGKTAEKRRKWWPYAIPSVGLFFLFILFQLLEVAVPGCWAISWFFYLCFTCQITAIRIRTREIYDIIGNASEDFFASMILYPNVATQLDLTTENLSEEGTDENDKANYKNKESIDLENIQEKNGSYDKDENVKVNYAYEKE